MISAWELYLWTRLDMVESLCITVGVLVIVSLVASAILYGESFLAVVTWNDDSSYDKRKRKDAGHRRAFVVKSFKFIVLSSVFWFILALVPTKKEAAMIWVVPQLATVENAELLQGEAAEIYNLAKDALKESIGTETVTE